MTASPFYKMMMYESAFGLSRARVLVFLYLILQTVLLIAMLYKIWLKNFPFLKAAFVFTIVFYIAVNYINIDKIVAERNIERYEKTGNIDFMYLINNLSGDAFETVYQFGVDRLGYQPDQEYTIEMPENYVTEQDYEKAAMLYRISGKQREIKRYCSGMRWQEYNLTAQRLINLK
jgi:hypothetical protein